MIETYRQLKELSALYQGTEDTNQVALQYQDEEDAILLSYVFCKHFGLTVTLTGKYFGLSQEDFASFALEELHKAMMHYRTDGGAKLTTLYSRFLNNRLRTETQFINYDKRKSNNMTESFDSNPAESTETTDSSSHAEHIGYSEDSFSEIELLMSLADKGELTENEYRYCEIIIKEVTDVTQIKDSEIASRLNLSSAAVHYIKERLRKKIGIETNTNFLLNF
jgi:DNA-directed RNA polymerase specialized sigma24 family protein